MAVAHKASEGIRNVKIAPTNFQFAKYSDEQDITNVKARFIEITIMIYVRDARHDLWNRITFSSVDSVTKFDKNMFTSFYRTANMNGEFVARIYWMKIPNV